MIVTTKLKTKKLTTLFVICVYLIQLFSPLAILVTPRTVDAATGGSCKAPSSGSPKPNVTPDYGGVALDRAAEFLADMDDITGAYYDEESNRIVFIGTTTSTLPEFNKDDLAVAIRAVIFNNALPAVSIEMRGIDPDPDIDPVQDVVYTGEIENTNFGKVLFDADMMLKRFTLGYDENENPISTSVTGYKSVFERYIELDPLYPDKDAYSRYWISPQEIVLKEATSSDTFIFDEVVMQVQTESIIGDPDQAWVEASEEFVTHHTEHFDEFAEEVPFYAKTKQLAKIVGVVKWIKDNGIGVDFEWAKNYELIATSTPTTTLMIVTPEVEANGYIYEAFGGIDYNTPNTYENDTHGTSTQLQTDSEAAATSSSDGIHWTFNSDGELYEAVSVSAEIFRTAGAYTISAEDMSAPTASPLPLEVTRSYSSFAVGNDVGFGPGWDIYPASLSNLKPGVKTTCTVSGGYSGSFPKSLAITSPYGRETFTFSCPTGYVADDSKYHSTLKRDSDGTFRIQTKDQSNYLFYTGNASTTEYKLMRSYDVHSGDQNSFMRIYNWGAATTTLLTIQDMNPNSSIPTTTNGHNLAFGYDGNGKITTVTGPSGVVHYSYNGAGDLVKVIDARGATTTYTYDNDHLLESITDREETKFVDNTYDSLKRVITQTDANDVTKTITYNEENLTMSWVDNNGRTGRSVYDELGRLTREVNSIGATTTLAYGTSTEDVPKQIIDARNATSTFTYDSRGNLTSYTAPNGDLIAYTWNASNTVSEINDHRYTSLFGSPRKTKYSYDVNSNLTQSSIAGQATTTYAYTSRGQIATTTDSNSGTVAFTYNLYGLPTVMKNKLGQNTTYTYDNSGRVTQVLDPAGAATNYTYDVNGNRLTASTTVALSQYSYDSNDQLSSFTDPSNANTTYSYSSVGKLATTTNPLSAITNYFYDSYNNLRKVKDSLSRETLFSHDALNREISAETPNGKVRSTQYDAGNNPVVASQPNGTVSTSTYDSLNRLITSKKGGIMTKYTYDSAGRVSTVADSTGTTTYTYDIRDRVTQVTNPYGLTVGYEYDDLDNLVEITYPDNQTVENDFNAVGQLTQQTDWNNDITTYTYTSSGLLSTTTMPNGITMKRAYDSANRLSSITYRNAAHTVIFRETYTRDARGFITDVSEDGAFTALTETDYEYDATGRLINTNGDVFDQTYEYDTVGNLIEKFNTDASTTHEYSDDDELSTSTLALNELFNFFAMLDSVPSTVMNMFISAASSSYAFVHRVYDTINSSSDEITDPEESDQNLFAYNNKNNEPLESSTEPIWGTGGGGVLAMLEQTGFVKKLVGMSKPFTLEFAPNDGEHLSADATEIVSSSTDSSNTVSSNDDIVSSSDEFLYENNENETGSQPVIEQTEEPVPTSDFSNSQYVDRGNKFSLEMDGGNQIEISKMKPSVTFEYFGGESSFSVLYGDNSTPQLIEGKKLKYAVTPKEAVQVYPLEAKKGMEQGGFEMEVVLDEAPLSNVFTFTIENIDDLDFLYQPALTQEEIEAGSEQPENVSGSYAVYHKSKKDNEYKTGKIAHIYRPHVVDSANNEVWGTLEIINNELKVTVPEEFLKNATYPVTVDPTFGYTSVGGTSVAVGTDRFSGSLFTTPSDYGSFTSMSYYCDKATSGSENSKALIVVHSTLNLATNGVATSSSCVNGSPAWKTPVFPTSPSLTANTEYVLGAVSEGVRTRLYYDTGAANQGHIDSTNSYTTPANLGSATHDTRKYSVYITYATGSSSNATATAPTSLETEGATNPTNVTDSTPELSAIYNDPDTNDVATAYQIQVSTSSIFSSIKWDSLKTTLSSSTPQGSRIAPISYSGSALASSTTYYWRIRFWDTANATGTMSTATSTFSLAASATNTAPSAPSSLLAEGQTNPINVTDSTPEFSAIYNDPNISDIATLYQIEVSTSSSFAVIKWNSGKTSLASSTSQGARIADISYGGSALASSTTYYWRIKFWDAASATGTVSTATSTFSLAASATNTAPSAPSSLLAEGQINPTSTTDSTPEFSAIFIDPDTGNIAIKYQIQVSTSSSFTSTKWDSSSTTLASTTSNGTRIADISYSGTVLASSTTYYWRIKFWDAASAEGSWSTTTSTFSLAAASSSTTSSTSYTYDDSGNLISAIKGALSKIYTWNPLGLLASVVIDGLSTIFTYDAEGNRIEKVSEGAGGEQGGGSVIFADSFTEAADTYPTSHTPNTGISWSSINTSGSGSSNSVKILASSDTLNGSISDATAGVMYSANTTYNSPDYQVKFTLTTAPTFDEYLNVGLRMDGTGANGYLLEGWWADNHDPAIYKVSGGVFTELATHDSTNVTLFNNGDIVRGEVSGSDIVMFDENDIGQIYASDSTFASANKAAIGFGAYRDVGGDIEVSVPVVDDVEITELGTTTSWRSPATTGETNNNWVNPTNAYSSNDTRATIVADTYVGTGAQDYGDFGFNINSGNEILGIEVKVESLTDSSGYHDLAVAVSKDNGSSWSSEKTIRYEDFDISDGTKLAGHALSLWGYTWSPSELSNTNFRVKVRLADRETSTVDDLGIDQISVKVFYIPSSGGNVTKRYVNDVLAPYTLVLAETDEENVVNRLNIWGPNGLVSTGGDTDTDRYYPLINHQGTVRFLTDSSGNLLNSYTYSPHGEVLSSEEGETNPYQFTSEQFDEETGLLYLRARYYDPETGRFISRDPVRGTLDNPLSQNPYVYSLDNPVAYSDPSGEFVWQALLGLFVPIVEDPCTDINPTQEQITKAYLTGDLFFMAEMMSGGGQAAKSIVSKIFIKHEHAIQHMIEGVSEEVIDAAIKADILVKGVGAVGKTVKREIVVAGRTLEYRVHTVTEDFINVGTYFFK
ncbi:hypothetical protein IPH92_02135 [Candidatus Kaiserbacteria bacterium]|nr:MAG: hypothetical protein IPH92_02135 [Candidatus Kaiserbacteria bacterium]